MFKILTVADKLLILFLCGAVIASFVFVQSLAGQGVTVLIQVEGIAVRKAELGTQQVITVRGVEGDVVVETRDGKVAITHADCPNHICVKTGWHSRTGDIIVCVPNRTIVRILGDNKQGVKAVTG